MKKKSRTNNAKKVIVIIYVLNLIVFLFGQACGCIHKSSTGEITSDSNVIEAEVGKYDSSISLWNNEENSEKIDLDFYYSGDPGFPEKSIPNRIIIGSAGCCFRARNVVLYLLEENGKATPLLSEELICNHDTYECISVPQINTPVEVHIDFTEEYADVKRISLKVANYSNTDEMLNTGLLLCFEDGTLTVFSGKEKTIYKAGIFFGDEKGYWYQSVDTNVSH